MIRLYEHPFSPYAAKVKIDDYTAPFAYGGTLKEVIFDIPTRQPPGEARAEVRAEMARQ